MKSFEYTDVLMLLGDQLILTKYQNPISTVETAVENADNLWCLILDFCWNLFQLEDTQVYFGVNLCVSETTNKLTGTTQKSALLSLKPIQIPVVTNKLYGYLNHHKVIM